jgi:hypothetical protein
MLTSCLCVVVLCGCAGDLSVGDPGFSSNGMHAGEDAGTADWWSAEHQLLSAPKRNAGLGINYNRSAKQVGCILLCLPRLHAGLSLCLTSGAALMLQSVARPRYQLQPLSKAGALRWSADASFVPAPCWAITMLDVRCGIDCLDGWQVAVRAVCVTQLVHAYGRLPAAKHVDVYSTEHFVCNVDWHMVG